MNYFSSDFIDFFKELAAHNDREWFHENKKRYEQHVKIPFENLVRDLIDSIGAVEQNWVLEPKDCILRINRDIRFSKDKSPYNLHVTAFISPGGRKDKSLPGFFIRITPEEIGIMGGCYGPSKEQLHAIRQTIGEHMSGFQELIFSKEFVSLFGEMKGEKHKRLPLEFQELTQKEPLIANKQFYYSTLLDASAILKEDLLETLMKYYYVMRPLNQFLTGALSNKPEPMKT